MHRYIIAITVDEDSIYYELTHTELILEYMYPLKYIFYMLEHYVCCKHTLVSI